MADQKRCYPRGIASDLPDDPLPSDYFVIPAPDDKGHTVREQFRCSPELNAQFDEIISSRRYPFRTKGDLLRFAAFDTCRRLLRYVHGIPDLINRLEIIHVITRRKQRSAEFEKSVQELRTTIDELQRIGADDEIVDLLNEVGAQVTEMVEIDAYWGNRYKDEIERHWGPLRRELEARLTRYPVDWSSLRRQRNGDAQ